MPNHTTGFCAVDECLTPQDTKATSLPLCWEHLREAAVHALRFDGENPSTMAGMVGQRARLMDDGASKPKTTPVVYYVAMNEYIKIGVTTNLAARMAAMYVQPEWVLAVEPGGSQRERQRHQEFTHLRRDGTELFQRGPELVRHIDQARAMFGDPAKFMHS